MKAKVDAGESPPVDDLIKREAAEEAARGTAFDVVTKSEVAVESYRTLNRHLLSPAERGEKLGIPRLMSEIQGSLEFADTDVFMEYSDWSLLNHPARLDENEFTIREMARSFEIDIDGRQVRLRWTQDFGQVAKIGSCS